MTAEPSSRPEASRPEASRPEASRTEGGGRLHSADLWAGAATTVVGVIGLVSSLSISAPSALAGLLGPREGPLTVSILLIVLGLLLAVRALLAARPQPPDFGRLSTTAAVVAALALFAALFRPLGFWLAAFAMLAVLYRYLGERRLWLIALVAAGTSTAVYVAFRTGLNVGLPTSPFGF